MTRKNSDIGGSGFRRVVGMILLFAFLGVSLSVQGEASVNDTVTGVRPPDPDSTDEQINPPDNTGPGLRNPSSKDSLRISTGKKRQDQVNREDIEHSPTKAMTYALILPGLGQVYNKKYFKIPIVYGALGVVGYWIHFNTQGYRQSSQNYTDDPSDFNERYLRLWRRQLELSYITLAATYALQVLDAYVDAHLFFWDVSPDLAIRVEPAMKPLYLPAGRPAGNYGISCKLTF